MNHRVTPFSIVATTLAAATLSVCGCATSQRSVPVVSYVPQAQLEGYDAIIVASGVT